MFLFHRYKLAVARKLSMPFLMFAEEGDIAVIDIANTASLIANNTLLSEDYTDYIVKPPFNEMWLEYKGDEVNKLGDTILCVGEMLGEDDELNELTIHNFSRISHELAEELGLENDLFYRGVITAYFDNTGQLQKAEGTPDGSYGFQYYLSKEYNAISDDLVRFMNTNKATLERSLKAKMVLDFNIVMTSITFMHYKDIEIIDHPNPKKLGMKSYTPEQRKVYKVINIDPLLKKSRIVRAEDGPNKGDRIIKTALHICRGHYKEYTEDKPMFGNPKLTGKIWIKSHTRGNRDNGEVVKSYKT